MPRPFTCAQRDENLRFLEALGETGNSRLAARVVGRAHSTMHTRKLASAAFAQDWAAAVAAAHARFHLGGGKRGPEVTAPRKARGTGPGGDPSLRTRGGEAVVVRTKAGTLQLRLAQKGKLSAAAEQVFLSALSASANVRLSAAAAGASPRAFYRRQKNDPAFAREMRLALETGYERLECAMMETLEPESGRHDAWRSNDPPALPPMGVSEALQLLHLHHKTVRLGWEEPHRRRRRNEPWEVYMARRRAIDVREMRREAEDKALKPAAIWEETGGWRGAGDPPPPVPVPPLHLVTGWSRATGRAPYHEGVALFGGWRLADMERTLKGRG